MAAAYEGALTHLELDREDALTELIAKPIVNVTPTGERDPEIIKDRALNSLGMRRTAAQGRPLVRSLGSSPKATVYLLPTHRNRDGNSVINRLIRPCCFGARHAPH